MVSQDAMSVVSWRGWVLGAFAVALLAGCEMKPSVLPNSDKNLRKSTAEFAADAAKRQYPTTAPRGGDVQAQASIDYGFDNRIDAVNLSGDTWNQVELWVNEKYVIFIPVWQTRELKRIGFRMLYDRDGMTFPTDNKQFKVEKVEVFRDGKLYAVPMKLAD
jgi:hypothetical protein